MEAKYLAEEVIIHPNHHLTFGDWIPRVGRIFTVFFPVFLGETNQKPCQEAAVGLMKLGIIPAKFSGSRRCSKDNKTYKPQLE